MVEGTCAKLGRKLESNIYVKLIDWENVTTHNALLTDRQNELCNMLAVCGAQDQLSLDKQQNDTRLESTQETLLNSVQIVCGDRIENAISFLVWFDAFMKSVDHSTKRLVWYQDQLKQCCYFCAAMHQLINLSKTTLSEVKNKWEYTSGKTISLNEASKKIMKSQHDLMEVHGEIRHKVRHFSQIEKLTCRLQSAAQIPVYSKVDECLTTIDESILFIQNNVNFKDASMYSARYKHLLTKVLDLIRSYVTQVIKNAAADSLNFGEECTADQDAAFALYYGKFHNSAAKVQRVSKLIEDRITRDSEYENLLSDMHKVYFTERANVLTPAIQKSITALATKNKGDYCILTRSVCGLLAHVCQDEHRLFYLFFSTGAAQLMSYLEGLCLMLYDSLRPYLIHIIHLETLAEICGIIKIEMIEENSHSEGALEAFISVMRQLLQDAQERLVFRTHIYVNSDILHYNPSSGDLAYPQKLQMMENIAANFIDTKNSPLDANTTSSSDINLAQGAENRAFLQISNSPADLHGMWYPTVRRTLICLSRLYRCVDPIVFQGLSQEAIRCCLQSLDKAAFEISRKQSNIDGFLFQIKHLLILREQMAPFRTEFTIKETSLDFSKMKTAAFDLLQKRKQLFSFKSNNALLEFLFDGTPQVREYFMDSRKEVDKCLKLTCEQFIKCSVNKFVAPLVSFLEKAEAFSSNSLQTSHTNSAKITNNRPKLGENAWASAKHVKDLISLTSREIKNELPGLQRSMKLYLSNRDTEFIIFRLIKNNIINTFTKLEHLILNNGYTTEEITIIDCPSVEQVSVLISSVSILSESTVIERT